MKIKAHEFIDSAFQSKKLRAYDRLIALMFKRGWKVGGLNDRGVPGILKCAKVWLELNGYKCEVSGGNIVQATKNTSSIIVEVVPNGYHSPSPSQKNLIESIHNSGNTYVICRTFADFIDKYDRLQMPDDT